MQFVVFSEGFKFKTIFYKLCTTNYTAEGTNLKFVFILQALDGYSKDSRIWYQVTPPWMEALMPSFWKPNFA